MNKKGILIVGHGSRRAEANEDVRNAARKIRKRGDFELVEAAFLEIAQPDIPAGFARLVEQGARHIIVHPYFLSPGRHTRGDIPIETEAAAGKFGVTYQITEPLAAHAAVIEASVDRIRTSQKENSGIDPYRLHPVNSPVNGIVYLVGAGPGDPGLLTVRAHNLLASCDTVIYDNLVNPEILEAAPESAYRIYVGKIGGGRQTSQAEINRLMVLRARSGEKIVRLKGGDPFIYGRGGEEALALGEAGIRFEIVPGISSAVAVPAYAGIPLTHRKLSKSIAILTGARAGDGGFPDSLAVQAGNAETIVILMGVRNLRQISAEFIAAGRGADLPVAVIRRGTYGEQETVIGTLETIAEKVARRKFAAPAVIVVGEVVRLSEKLWWFENKADDGSAQNLFSNEVRTEINKISQAAGV